jgi:hypothetical protein
MEDKKQSDATMNVELREKSGTTTLIKAHLRRKNLDSTQREELKGNLTLLNTFITELKEQMKAIKEHLKNCQLNIADSKKLATCRDERGKPEASISAEIDILLERYKATRDTYHGGDYNGVSC